MNATGGEHPVPERVQRMLRQRFHDNPGSAGIAIVAASETLAEGAVLDELASAWHALRVAQAEAAAALSGAIAAAALENVPRAEISRRAGVPPETIEGLGG